MSAHSWVTGGISSVMARWGTSKAWLRYLLVGSLALAATVGPSTAATSIEPQEALPGSHRVLVKIAPGANALGLLGGGERVFGRWHVRTVPKDRAVEDVLEELRSRPEVEAAELDFKIELGPELGEPGPKEASSQSSADDPWLGYQWHFPAIQLESAWDEGTGEGVVVAVVDSGVSRDGEDLDCHTFVAPYNAITKTSGIEAARDDQGHGTHVAGTVAQCTDNGVGVAGVAFEAELMPVKVLDSTGTGWMSDIAHGIHWARTHGADVINLSLGGASSSPVMDEAIEAAVDEGIVIVAAAGNSYPEPVLYPANHPKVIAVGATGFDNQRAPYSNVGAALDMVAPGGNLAEDLNLDGYGDGVLQETCDPELSGCSVGWGYYFLQGTSMAAPHVSGAAALLKSIVPGLDATGVQTILESTALDLGPSGIDSSYGHGLIQVHDAITFLDGPDTNSPSWPGGAELEAQLVSGDTVELRWPAANDDKALAGYRVYRDGTLIETAPAAQDSTLVSGLGSNTAFEFKVRAEDLSGNLSPALVADVETPDTAPPAWDKSAGLTVKEYGETKLVLQWPGATDDVGVTQYRLRLTGSTGILTSDTSATISGLQPGRPHVFEVSARDAAGNWSGALSGVVRTAQAFGDTLDHTFHDDILWMSGKDITRGCNPPANDMFCPDDPVTRGQMAAFVVRALGLTEEGHEGFADVPASSTFARDIGLLATAGVTRGCNPPANDQFCPSDPITRGELAAFLHRALR